MANVPLTEDFTSTGWSRYSIPSPFTTANSLGRQPNVIYPWGLGTLDHVDLRSFAPSSAGIPENWVATPSSAFTSFSVGYNASINNWPMMKVSYVGSSNLTLVSVSDPVDLTAIGEDAILQVALPNFPASFSGSTSYLELSSDGFNQEICSLTWSSAVTVPTVSTSTMMAFSYDQLTGIDLTSVNGVRIRIDGAATGSYTFAALRLVGPGWVQPSVDFDTWNGILRQSISLIGTNDEPVPANQSIPPVWFSASTGGTDDPQPINGTFGILFNTGANSGTDSFGLNMRAVGGTDTSQLLLQGLTQAQLNGPQPGLISTAEIPRTMGDLEGLTMGEMSQSMLNLDAVAENVSTTWLSLLVQWGNSPVITVGNSLGVDNYSWTGDQLPTFSNSTTYLAILKLIDNQVRVQIFNVDQIKLSVAPGATPIFDSGIISDSYQFIRRPGRIGWQASFTDGNSYIISMCPMSLNFAEYQSTPLNSNTPVAGARLYAQASSNLQLWQNFSSLPISGGPVVSQDTNRTITGSSTKVYLDNPSAGQGVISNVLSPDALSGITDMANTVINLSVWLPSASQGRLSMYLLGDHGYQAPLNVPNIIPDQWQPITFNAPPNLQSGNYQLVIVYEGSSTAAFWIDAVSVEQRVVTWSARANMNDPWTSFNDVINTDSGGVVFSHKGTQLQIRAQAHRQDAAIMSAPKIIPIYAQLGKPLWPEDTDAFTDPYAGGLSAAFSHSTGGSRIYTLTATSPENYITNYIWSISDGTVLNGSSTAHQFPLAAPSNTDYNVTLSVIDVYGNQTSTTQILTIP